MDARSARKNRLQYPARRPRHTRQVIPVKRPVLRSVSVFVLLALSLVAFPSLAFAGVSEYQVQFAPADTTGNGVFVVNVILSPDTKLPAKVRVPLPTGAVLLWSGEILGGDVSADPSREASITPTGGGLVVEFTIEKVRVAQVEAQWSAPTISGTKVTSDLEWVNTTDAGTYTFAIRLPAGATDVKITPAVEGDVNTNAAGETLRTLTPIRLEKGAAFPISIAFKTGGATGGGGIGDMPPILIAVVAALALAIVALVVVVVRQSAARGDARPQAPAAARTSSPVSSRRAGSETGAPAPKTPKADSNDESDDDAFTWE